MMQKRFVHIHNKTQRKLRECVEFQRQWCALCPQQQRSDGWAHVPERAGLPVQTSGVFQRLQGLKGNVSDKLQPIRLFINAFYIVCSYYTITVVLLLLL